MALLLGLLTVPVSSAVGDEGPVYDTDVATIANLPMMPSDLVITHGRAHVVRHTVNGILGNEFGFTADSDPAASFLDEALPMGDPDGADLTQPGPLPIDVRYAEVFQNHDYFAPGAGVNTYVAVVGRTGDDAGASDEEATDWQLAVAGPLDKGMPLRWTQTLGVDAATGAPRGLAVVGDDDEPKSMVVNFGNDLNTYVPIVDDDGYFTYTTGPALYLDDADTTIEHLVHRQLWDNPTDVGERTFHDDDAGSMFVALVRKQRSDGDDDLIPTIYKVDGGYTPDGTGHSIVKVGDRPALRVVRETRAVVAYDWVSPDREGDPRAPSVLNNLSRIETAVAIAPDAGGPVQTRAWHPEYLTVQGIFPQPHSSGLGSGVGRCDDAGPGEVPALDINVSQVGIDIPGIPDFGQHVTDMSCAVRDGSGQVALSYQTWINGSPTPNSYGGFSMAGSSPAGTAVGVAQVHGCAQINRQHKRYIDNGKEVTPFGTASANKFPTDNDFGHLSEAFDCSAFSGASPGPGGQPLGTYPGSVTPLTVAGGSGGVTMLAQPIPSRVASVSATGALTMNDGGAGPALRVPIASSVGGALIEPLPRVDLDISLRLDDRHPVLKQLAPQPIGLIAAPPLVRGAGQEQDAPEFGRSTTSGGASSTFESNSASLTVGLHIEPPISNAYEVDMSITAAEEQTNEEQVETSVEIGNMFTGAPEENTVVYNATQAYHWTGKVIKSSIGVGIGTDSFIDRPKQTVMSSASVSKMAEQFPQTFGPSGLFRQGVDEAFSHTVGDPGSYIPFDDGRNKGAGGGNVDDYCKGTIAGEAPDLGPVGGPDLGDRARSLLEQFTGAPDPTLPDVLVSNSHQVQVGSTNSEGASFALDKTESSTLTSEASITAEVSARVGTVTAGASVGHGWGTSSTTSLGNGTSFSGYVGNIPSPNLVGEEYNWRMFMCQRDLIPGLGVWVLNYTVDDYDGSHGLDPMDDITNISPTGFDTISGWTPTMKWTQPTGTVKKYDVELETFLPKGAPDTRTTSAPDADGFDNSKQAKFARSITKDSSVPVVPVGAQELLADQWYRWRVHGIDFLDNTTVSNWSYFKTPAKPAAATAPTAAFDLDDWTPVADTSVEFFDQSDSGGLPLTYAWDFGDGETSTEASPTHTYAAPGTYAVELEVTNSKGSDQEIQTVIVVPAVAADSYTFDEGQPLTLDADHGVLANDVAGTDPVLTVMSPPADGDLQLNQDGGFTYTPEAGTCADRSFVYKAESPANHRSASATVTLDALCRPVVSGTAVAPGTVVGDGDIDITSLAKAEVGSTIVSASVTVDGGTPVALIAADGQFDEQTESLEGTVTLTGLATGDRTVCVTAIDDHALVSEPDCTDVTVASAPPVASFGSTPNDPVAGSPVTFTDTSSRDGLPATYAWDFGDGKTSSDAVPEHSYDEPGTYTISLTVTTTAGSDDTSGPLVVGPGLVPDDYTFDQDVKLEVDAAHGVLSNDIVGAATATVTADPAEGTLAMLPDGSFSYQPLDGSCDPQVFSYQVTAAGRTATTTATLNGVCASVDPPAGPGDPGQSDPGGPADPGQTGPGGSGGSGTGGSGGADPGGNPAGNGAHGDAALPDTGAGSAIWLALGAGTLFLLAGGWALGRGRRRQVDIAPRT